MLLRRKMDPKAGCREVRERVTKLLIAVITTSSTIFFSSITEAENEMTHEQNGRWCLIDLLRPSSCPLGHPLPSSNFHLRGQGGKTQRQSEHAESSRYIWQSDKERYQHESRHKDTEILAETVKFINLTLVSDPLVVAPIFKSARNSGKLRKQSARSASNPSLTSFLSSAWSNPRRDSRSVQCDWSDSSPSYADKATKLYLCNAFLIRARSWVRMELNNFRTEFIRIPNEDARSCGLDRGLSSFKSLYSCCDTNNESRTKDNLTITYARNTQHQLDPFCELPPCRQRVDRFCSSQKLLSLAF